MEQVRRLRLEKKWNQNELAFHADLAPSVISQIETGKREPSASTLRKLAAALQVEIPDLFKSPTPPKAKASPGAGQPEESEGERLVTKLIRRLIADLEADADRWEALDGEVSLAVYRELVGRRLSIQSSLNALDDVREALDVNISDWRGSPLRRVRRALQSAFNRWNAARSALIDLHFDAVLKPEEAEQEDAEQKETGVEATEGDARPVTDITEWQAEKLAGANTSSSLLSDAS